MNDDHGELTMNITGPNGDRLVLLDIKYYFVATKEEVDKYHDLLLHATEFWFDWHNKRVRKENNNILLKGEYTMEYTDRQYKIINEYRDTKNEIMAQYNADLIACNDKKYRATRNFESAKNLFRHRQIENLNRYQVKLNELKNALNNETSAVADDMVEKLKLQNEYSIAVEANKEIRNACFDQMDDDLDDAKNMFNRAMSAWLKELRDISVKRDSALNRAKEVMQEALEALAVEEEAAV